MKIWQKFSADQFVHDDYRSYQDTIISEKDNVIIVMRQQYSEYIEPCTGSIISFVSDRISISQS